MVSPAILHAKVNSPNLRLRNEEQRQPRIRWFILGILVTTVWDFVQERCSLCWRIEGRGGLILGNCL